MKQKNRKSPKRIYIIILSIILCIFNFKLHSAAKIRAEDNTTLLEKMAALDEAFNGFIEKANKLKRTSMLAEDLERWLCNRGHSYRGLHEQLAKAAAWNNQELVELIIEIGITTDKRDSNQMTALMHAVDNGNEKIVSLLLKLKSIDTLGNRGTALHIAANKGRAEIAQLLINAGADIDERDCDGNTALRVAIREQNKKIVELLLHAGARICRYSTDMNLAKSKLELAHEGDKEDIRSIISMLETEPERRNSEIIKYQVDKIAHDSDYKLLKELYKIISEYLCPPIATYNDVLKSKKNKV